MDLASVIALKATLVLAVSLILLIFGYAYVNVLPQQRMSTLTAWVVSLGTWLLRGKRVHAVLYWLLPLYAFSLHPLAGVLLLLTACLGWAIDKEYGHVL